MKARLSITEKLSYTRIVDVELPEEMTEAELEDLLEDADRSFFIQSASDYIRKLQDSGIRPLDCVDDSLDSPDDVEVECETYEPIDDDMEE